MNEYLRQIAGEDFTAKDFRTWGGTVLAAIALSKQEEFETKKQAKSNIKTAICAVAELLGNTPAVCRKCYVHPVIVEAYLKRTRYCWSQRQHQIIGASQSPRSGTSSSKVPPRALNHRSLQKSHRFSFAMLHLVHSALARIFVRSPTKKSCAVPKAAAGKMIIADFHDNFWRDWFPLLRCAPCSSGSVLRARCL